MNPVIILCFDRFEWRLQTSFNHETVICVVCYLITMKLSQLLCGCETILSNNKIGAGKLQTFSLVVEIHPIQKLAFKYSNFTQYPISYNVSHFECLSVL